MVKKHKYQNNNKPASFKLKEFGSTANIIPEYSTSVDMEAVRYNQPVEETSIQTEPNVKADHAVSEQELKHYYMAFKINGYSNNASLNKCINFFSQDKNLTLLHLAAQDGNVDAIKNLIKRGAKFTKDIYRKTPLHYASIDGKSEVLEVLIKMLRCDRSEINRQDQEGNTPLHYASNVNCVQCLTANGARIIKNNQGHTQFHTFAIRGLKECVEYLIYNLGSIRDLDARR
ncbi:ankyrin repeat domain-containing protein [Wolbachia endosymbiont of Ctenocephalides felis wCfeT]|uniref:ankyrin repeat domain-containing protein n=1 Tax=Wolbachia endosymbiont of Ctenocephalides felis wCfeT TaxID=2732593 RepID=UPI0014462FCE|nr:ankyrin repeat domain-containing protein [Wolbachia endosymbiont of Ctenocephalides felis wCfeT]